MHSDLAASQSLLADKVTGEGTGRLSTLLDNRSTASTATDGDSATQSNRHRKDDHQEDN
ncbi:MAG: hypothetical protein ACE361_06695 [Aureliella sp.]